MVAAANVRKVIGSSTARQEEPGLTDVEKLEGSEVSDPENALALKRQTSYSSVLTSLLYWQFETANEKLGVRKIFYFKIFIMKIVCACSRKVSCEFGAFFHNSEFSRNVKLHSGAEVRSSSIGSNSYVGHRSKLSHVTIGRFCSIGQDSLIGPGLHPVDFFSTSPIFYSNGNQLQYNWHQFPIEFSEHQPVIIGDDVWIGSRCIVLDGVSIAQGSIIAAGSVVTRDTVPYGIYAGVPAKLIKYRFKRSIIDKIMRLNFFEKSDDEIRCYQHVIVDPEAVIGIADEK